MILLNVYSILVLIIAISLNDNVNAEDKKQSSVVQNIINTLKQDCNTIENLPERVCHTTINALESETKNVCRQGTGYMCDVIPWFLQIIVSAETCKNELDKYICTQLDNVGRMVMGYVENECEEELEKIFTGHGCDLDGNKMSICDGLPTTVDGICSTVVDAVCDQLPSILHTFTPFCQETFDRLLCNEGLAGLPRKFQQTTPVSYHLDRWQVVGMP